MAAKVENPLVSASYSQASLARSFSAGQFRPPPTTAAAAAAAAGAATSKTAAKITALAAEIRALEAEKTKIDEQHDAGDEARTKLEESKTNCQTILDKLVKLREKQATLLKEATELSKKKVDLIAANKKNVKPVKELMQNGTAMSEEAFTQVTQLYETAIAIEKCAKNRAAVDEKLAKHRHSEETMRKKITKLNLEIQKYDHDLIDLWMNRTEIVGKIVALEKEQAALQEEEKALAIRNKENAAGKRKFRSPPPAEYSLPVAKAQEPYSPSPPAPPVPRTKKRSIEQTATAAAAAAGPTVHRKKLKSDKEDASRKAINAAAAGAGAGAGAGGKPKAKLHGKELVVVGTYSGD